MSILFHHYKQLTECITEVEHLDARVNSSKKRLMEEQKKEEIPASLDNYLEK